MTSRSSQAFWILAPAAVAPMASIVVILEVPMLSIGVMQERGAKPSICTVQAPQSATPQPDFVPFMPSTSRNTHRRGVSPSTSTVRSTPLTLILVAIAISRLFAWIGYAKDGGILSASSIALQFICVRIYHCTMHMHNYLRTHVNVNPRSACRRDWGMTNESQGTQ